MFSSAQASTFHHQGQLPKLPIPTIAESVALFLKTAKPIATPEEYAEAERLGEDLQANYQHLQEALEAHNAVSKSFVEEYWWDSYLTDRNRCCLNVNPFFVFEEDPTPLRTSQIARAASLVISALKFANAVREEKLEPDMWRSVAMCMYQYPRLFATSRAARPDKDEALEFPDARHIVVISRNQFYWFDAMTKDGKNVGVSEDIIADNLRLILEDSSQLSEQECSDLAVGILSSQDREAWAKHRNRLAELDARNKESINLIDSAMFILCLDNNEPATADQMCDNALHGTSVIESGVQIGTVQNRWFDKTIQFIVSKNGSAGLNFEHSVVDGHSVLRFASDVFTDTILRFAKTIRGDVKELLVGKNSAGVDSAPRKIVWRLSGDLRHAIKTAEADMSDAIGNLKMRTLEFSGYGKRWIIRQNLSPDAYVQAMFQLAYYRLYGRFANTYETVQTKKFRHGRTECARSLTAELAEFVKIFCSDASGEEKVHAMQRAGQAHTELVRDRAEGIGFERHLAVLNYLYTKSVKTAAAQATLKTPSLEQHPEEDSQATGVEGPTTPSPTAPPFFAGKAWKKIQENTLSTSNCGNPSLRAFGFGPVCDAGLGIGYILKDDAINLCVSSWQRQTLRYTQMLERCFNEMRDLLEACNVGSFTLTNVGQRVILPIGSFVINPSIQRKSSVSPQ